MPRQAGFRSRVRPRSSLKFCQEHCCCPQDKPNTARYHCSNCKTFQCEDCCRELHLTLRNHEPSELEKIDPQFICVRKNCYNFADFFCSTCDEVEGGSQLCVTCNQRVHTGFKYNHISISFDDHRRNIELQKKKDEEKLKQNQIEESHTNGSASNSSSLYNSFEDSETCLKSIPPNNLHSSALRPRSPLSASPAVEALSKEESDGDQEESLGAFEHNFSASQSLDQFYSICEQIPSPSPEMRATHGTSSRGRVPKPERQNSGDSAVMTTLNLESRGPMVDSETKSLHLINEEEELLISDAEEFLTKLGLSDDERVKVVSIFGNTGVGKSYTLNTVFFRGEEVFATSAYQDSCTYGVWIAYDCRLQCLVIDTEGLLGHTTNEARRKRLLLKVLGISDVVIYRTNASRLENDMFYFLHDASKAFEDYFAEEFKAIIASTSSDIPVTSMSPTVIIFHETKHTRPLSSDSQEAVAQLNRRAKEMKLSLSAFPGLKYVGIQSARNESTDFKPLEFAIKRALDEDNTCARISRPAHVVFDVLSQLNKKYSGDIPVEEIVAFSSKYFSCRMLCEACDQRCQLSLNHDGTQHHCKEGCKYRADIGNRVYLCRRCLQDGQEQLVRWQTCTSQESGIMGMVRFINRGYIIECPRHDVIYRSFERWYNNPPPEADATVIRMVHVWPGDIPLSADGTPGHVGQRIIDISNSVTKVVTPTLQVASEWMSDQVAPEYWTPNADAHHCKICRVEFGEKLTKHHCRRCGQCVCEHCSSKTMALPSWGARPVRVCDPCYDRPLCDLEGPDEGKTDYEQSEMDARINRKPLDVASTGMPTGVDAASDDQLQVTARVVTEKAGQAAGFFTSVFKQSAKLVKDWVRPDYWKPDSELIECAICKVPFGPTDDKGLQLKHGPVVERHHCRRCGDGFCSYCSAKRLPVPSRGWEEPVRVCDQCVKFPPPL